MNLNHLKRLLNLPASNSLKNKDNLQEPLTNIILPNDIICDQQEEMVDDTLRRSFSDSELFISIKSIKKYKKYLSVRERSRKLIDLLKLQQEHSKTTQLNDNKKVIVLHAGQELKQKQSKSLSITEKTNRNKQKQEVQIFFHLSFESNEQVGQCANFPYGRHNNLQDRYKNRPIFLHYEENRIQLQGPDELSCIERHHNSSATNSDSTISTKVTNKGSSNFRNNPQDLNKYNAIPINQIFDLSITNTFNEMHISNIMQGIIIVDFNKINRSSSKIPQIRNSNVKTNKACSPAIIRFLSQHVNKTNPPLSRPSTANKRIRKRTNEIRERFREISRTNTTAASSMSEKLFRKRIFRNKKYIKDNKRQ